MAGATRPRSHAQLPSYRLHKPSGRAVVTLNGRDHYLGPHGSDESRRAYDRLIAEWLANGRRPLTRDAPLTVVELVVAYYEHAERYYRKDGRATSTLACLRSAFGPLRHLYDDLPAADFSPLRLKAVRERMIARGWTRSTGPGRAGHRPLGAAPRHRPGDRRPPGRGRRPGQPRQRLRGSGPGRAGPTIAERGARDRASNRSSIVGCES